MNSFEAYTAFVAVKRHFSLGSTYDFHKYHGKIKLSVSSFENRNDRFFYEKLSRRREVVSFLVANLSDSPKLWIGDLFSNEAEARYERWVRVTESITYVTRAEMNSLDDFDSSFVFRDGEHPPALVAMLDKQVSPEVLHVVDELVGFTKHWEKYSWDPTVKQAVHRIRKLRGFVEFDRSKINQTLVQLFSAEVA